MPVDLSTKIRIESVQRTMEARGDVDFASCMESLRVCIADIEQLAADVRELESAVSALSADVANVKKEWKERGEKLEQWVRNIDFQMGLKAIFG